MAQKKKSRVAFVGLGNMGLGMAQNLLRAGYEVAGYDLSAARRKMLVASGGIAANNPAEAAQGAAAAFIMVMNGRQAIDASAGKGGLLESLRPGSVIVLSATVERDEAIELGRIAAKHKVSVVDAPVSGGLRGATTGTLTMMTAGEASALRKVKPYLSATGKKILTVGSKPGDGQTVKASLQALIGVAFAGIFEAMTLGARAGIKEEVLYEVFTNSVAQSPMLENTAKLIVARKFKNTGSNIATMHKDLGITTNLARAVGAPLFATTAARELFQAGMSMFPGEDNWCAVKVLEQLAGGRKKK